MYALFCSVSFHPSIRPTYPSSAVTFFVSYSTPWLISQFFFSPSSSSLHPCFVHGLRAIFQPQDLTGGSFVYFFVFYSLFFAYAYIHMRIILPSQPSAYTQQRPNGCLIHFPFFFFLSAIHLLIFHFLCSVSIVLFFISFFLFLFLSNLSTLFSGFLLFLRLYFINQPSVP